jgi:2-phosphoglycerate kinase
VPTSPPSPSNSIARATATTDHRIWLLAGASGTGKTTLAYPLAHRLGVPVVELDDIVEALLAMTTPEAEPLLHYWRTHPEAGELPVEAIVERQIAVAQALAPAVEAVIANHLETGTSVLIEGDYLLPSMTARPAFRGREASGAVRAVVLVEPDVRALTNNYVGREPSAGRQAKRAEVSRRYGDWLARQAVMVDVPVVPARPWATAEARVQAAFDQERG